MLLIEWLSLAQTIMLVAVAGVMIRYAHETNRHRRSTQLLLETHASQLDAQAEEIDAHIRPFIIVTPEEGSAIGSVENVGHGPAFNVRILDVVLHERIDGHPVRLRFPTVIPALRAGDRVDVPIQSYVGEHEFGGYVRAQLNPALTRERLQITIEYDNVQLKRYRVVQTIEPKSLRITEFRPA